MRLIPEISKRLHFLTFCANISHGLRLSSFFWEGYCLIVMNTRILKQVLKFVGALVVLAVLYKAGLLEKVSGPSKPPATTTVNQSMAPGETGGESRPVPPGAYHGFGKVYRLLPDDNEGTTHQRFLLRLDDGSSLLVAHNTSLAPRLNGLKPGDVVEFCGEFVDNDRGGLVHWTHRDPRGRHAAGWLRHNGKIYE